LDTLDLPKIECCEHLNYNILFADLLTAYQRSGLDNLHKISLEPMWIECDGCMDMVAVPVDVRKIIATYLGAEGILYGEDSVKPGQLYHIIESMDKDDKDNIREYQARCVRLSSGGDYLLDDHRWLMQDAEDNKMWTLGGYQLNKGIWCYKIKETRSNAK